jgi:putative membrane protein
MMMSHTLMQLLIAALLGGVGVLIVSKVVPGFEVKGGFGTAVVVGLVYGILKVLLQKLLIVLAFPVVLITFGLFIVVINAFLLWITDQLVSGFEVKSKTALVIGALLLSVIDIVFHVVLGGGAPY